MFKKEDGTFEAQDFNKVTHFLVSHVVDELHV